MKTVLLPVKDFADAKVRLSPALDSKARTGLAEAMCRDVMGELSHSTADRIVVYTSSDRVMAAVRPFGYEIHREQQVQGHSAAVNHLLPILAETSTRVFVIAADLPSLTTSEIDQSLDAECRALAIFPSRDGTGTNAMLFQSPARITLEYGDGSFMRHCQSAITAGFSPHILRLPGIAADVDTPEDLAHFLLQPRLDSETWRFLRTASIGA